MLSSRWLMAVVVLAAQIAAADQGRMLMQANPRPSFSCSFPGPYSYAVSVRDNTRDAGHLCGGVVIAKNAVLTAAHCVDPLANRKATQKPFLRIGGLNSDMPIQTRRTVATFFHKGWVSDSFDGNDLAILKLNETVCVNPIPTLGASGAEKNRKLTLLGYGKKNPSGSFAPVLQATDLFTFNRTYCNARFDLDPPLEKGQLCVRGKNDIGVCAGDDGGPLVRIPTIFVPRDVLIGIASYTSGPCTQRDGASVFMDIRHYRRWITRILRSKEFRRA